MDVSIIVTAYNYGKYIDECLDSCIRQRNTNLDYEVIVVDDGSTDETPALLARRSSPCLRLLRLKNSGIETASNHGFLAARGRFIVRVDADDVLEPDYLACMAPLMNQEFGFYYPDYTVIDSFSLSQEVVRLPEFDAAEVMTRGDFLATGTLYQAGLLHSISGYALHTRNSGLENYELILKLIAAGVKGVHVATPLFKYRRHLTNMSVTRTERIIAHGRAMFQHNGWGAFRTNQYHPYKLVLPERPV